MKLITAGATKIHKRIKLLINLSCVSGGGRVGGDGAAVDAAKLPGGGAGELRSLCGAGAAQESCKSHHGLPVCAGSQR